MSPVLLKTKDNKYISEIMQNTSHLQVSSKRKLFAPFESFMTEYRGSCPAINEEIFATLAIENLMTINMKTE